MYAFQVGLNLVFLGISLDTFQYKKGRQKNLTTRFLRICFHLFPDFRLDTLSSEREETLPLQAKEGIHDALDLPAVAIKAKHTPALGTR